ncbi:hypothetical protein BASA81_008365 [Batrachochytrium salamandrivorans]|nr:hypothetical protein BASA81_008365 [Batrachochytrium salamandrivorans]
MDHPPSMDSSASERRALKFKVFTFYGKWEPAKSVADVNDLCEWALGNGVQEFNSKLKLKYGEDLSTVSVSSYLDLPVETQLKLFYSEFDAHKPAQEIDNVAMFARQHGHSGLAEVNMKLNHKFGENLNSLAFGGRVHMRAILQAYFAKVDPLRASPENINVTIEYVVMNGALALIRELMDRYHVPLQLSVSEISGRTHEVELDPQQALKPTRPAVMSLMRGQVAPINVGEQPNPVRQVRPLSMALSNKSASSVHGQLTVSEDAEIKGLMEVFYAKNNPEKLAAGGVDALMKFCRVYGLDAVNEKLREKYDEDLNTLKAQYESLMEALTLYYGEVDPNKKNIEDIAAWAIVHGQMPLSERLRKRYGKPLFDSVTPNLAVTEPEPAMVPAPLSLTAALDRPKSVQSPPPLVSSPRVLSVSTNPELLRSKLTIFYKTFDSKPKSSEDLNTIVNWVMAGSSVAMLNKKLKDKYGKTLDDVDLIPAPSAPSTEENHANDDDSVPKASATTFPVPEEIHSTVLLPSKSTLPPPAANKPPSQSSSRRNSPQSVRSRSESVSSDVGSVDGMEEQMNNMRRITSGQYEQLGKQVRAFYRRYDPSKIENKEALDLVMKWTFKHGPDALNKQFEKNYGKALFSVVVDEQDEEADEEDDVMDAPPDW